jgi:hypothetical protein
MIMKTSGLIAIFFVGSLLCANVSLAQWKKVQRSSAAAAVPNAQIEWKTAASSETYRIEFSPKRLTRISPTIIRVWTRRHSLRENSDSGFTMALNEYNCRTRASRSVKTVMYDAAGKMLITSLTSELYSTPNAEWSL